MVSDKPIDTVALQRTGCRMRAMSQFISIAISILYSPKPRLSFKPLLHAFRNNTAGRSPMLLLKFNKEETSENVHLHNQAPIPNRNDFAANYFEAALPLQNSTRACSSEQRRVQLCQGMAPWRSLWSVTMKALQLVPSGCISRNPTALHRQQPKALPLPPCHLLDNIFLGTGFLKRSYTFSVYVRT